MKRGLTLPWANIGCCKGSLSHTGCPIQLGIGASVFIGNPNVIGVSNELIHGRAPPEYRQSLTRG
jgi:hypothetical protein